MLDDSVAESEEVEHCLIPLISQDRHLEGGLALQRDPQQVKYLVRIQ